MHDLLQEGLYVVLISNNTSEKENNMSRRFDSSVNGLKIIFNHNVGGVAGGFNRGVDAAIAEGVDWITLLDQDSRLSPKDLQRLREPWQDLDISALMVGPLIWDARRHQFHDTSNASSLQGYPITRLLSSSGTTFRSVDWTLLGPMNEWLVVDYVDHSWCFFAQVRQGFCLVQHPDVRLIQHFGHKHPNIICRWLGMELYSPRRHYYQLRNLRWLLRQTEVPIDVRCRSL